MDPKTIRCRIYGEEWYPVFELTTELDPSYLFLDPDGYVRAGDPASFAYEIPVELVRAYNAALMLFEEAQRRIKAFMKAEDAKEKSAKLEFGQ